MFFIVSVISVFTLLPLPLYVYVPLSVPSPNMTVALQTEAPSPSSDVTHNTADDSSMKSTAVNRIDLNLRGITDPFTEITTFFGVINVNRDGWMYVTNVM